MRSTAEPGPVTGYRALVPVGPSPIVKVVIKPMIKLLNPPIGKLAGRRHFGMAAQIHHVGRRSGKRYVTPARVRVDGDVALIPLTFGNQSDWTRNIRSAGRCWVQANGTAYEAVQPRFVDWAASQVRATFGRFERAGFRLLGIKQFMQLEVVPR